MKSNTYLLYISMIIFLIFLVILSIYLLVNNKKTKEKDNNIFKTKQFLVNDFFEFRKSILNNYDKKTMNFKGAYILYNKSKNMYYVGQSVDVIDRINAHFTGKGNGDVYADYKNGDIFLISYVLLSSTNYKDLNKLEKSLITAYHSNIDGYNKTKGNK